MTVLKYADRVAESTVSNGTGDIELAGAIDTDHATFGSRFADGEEMPVSVFGGGKWMTFRGRYNAGANSITRVTFRASSTGTNLSLSGTMTVMCGWTAADAAAMIRTDEAQSLSTGQKTQAMTNLGMTATGQALATVADAAAARGVLLVDNAPAGLTADYTVTAADYGRFFELNGSHTLSFDDKAALGNGFRCEIRNVDTGIWTLDPYGSQIIDGKTTIKLYSGESCIVRCDGNQLLTVGLPAGRRLIQKQTFSNQASVTFLGIDASFPIYEFEIDGLYASGAGTDVVIILAEAGPTYINNANAYAWSDNYHGVQLGTGTALASATISSGSSGTTSAVLIVGLLSTSPVMRASGRVRLLNPAETTNRKHIVADITSDQSNGYLVRSLITGVKVDNANPIIGARFFAAAGGSAAMTGSISMWGVP